MEMLQLLMQPFTQETGMLFGLFLWYTAFTAQGEFVIISYILDWTPAMNDVSPKTHLHWSKHILHLKRLRWDLQGPSLTVCRYRE